MSKNSSQIKQMNAYFTFIVIFLALTLSFFVGFAQKRKALPQKQISYNKEIQIDGNLSEWGDSLGYFYDKQDLQYEISQDEKLLYIAMRVKETSRQMQALHQGFSFVINAEGKKKEGAMLVFPVPDREALRALAGKDEEEQPEDMRIGVLNAVKGIYVAGMADVVDGLVSMDNDYGIKVAVAIDSSDAVCYEAAIPFERISPTLAAGKTVAINVKVNGIIMRTVGGSRPMGRYRNGGYGYPYGAYGAPPTRKEAQKEPGVWLILPLSDK